MSDDDDAWIKAEFISFGGNEDEDDGGVDEENVEVNLPKNRGDFSSDAARGHNSRQPQQQQQQSQQQQQGNPCYTYNQQLPPWMDRPTDYRRVNPLTALHNEIVSFCNLMQPLADEMEERKALVKRIETVVYRTFGGPPKCKVEVFGSQATGMFLPSSDIDLVIVLPEAVVEQEKDQKKQAATTTSTTSGVLLDDGKKQDGQAASAAATVGDESSKIAEQQRHQQQRLEDEREMANYALASSVQQEHERQSPLHRLAEALEEEFEANDELSYLEVIENTTVPLVKFTHGPTNISVDICVNREDGVRAATLINTFVNAMPPLRPLTFVLKYFLAARGINEPYSGGIGSYMLQLMIVSFLQARERSTIRTHGGHPNLYNLGCLLVEFLELYGLDFNYVTTGISVRHDGYYFPKGDKNRKEHFWQPMRQFSLAMENPLEPTSDIGRSSFRVQTVQRAFEVAFKVLLTHVASPVVPTESILASIIPPTDEMKRRLAAVLAAQERKRKYENEQSSSYKKSLSSSSASSSRRHESNSRSTTSRKSPTSRRSGRSSPDSDDMDTSSADDDAGRRRKRHRRR